MSCINSRFQPLLLLVLHWLIKVQYHDDAPPPLHQTVQHENAEFNLLPFIKYTADGAKGQFLLTKSCPNHTFNRLNPIYRSSEPLIGADTIYYIHHRRSSIDHCLIQKIKLIQFIKHTADGAAWIIVCYRILADTIY